MIPLDILSVGAVTPLGLSAPPTCAAFRAGLKALAEVFYRTFPAAPVIGGRVPASVRLRRTYADWLTNLATRSLAEAISGLAELPEMALILNLPEPARKHPALRFGYQDAILAKLQERVAVSFPIAEVLCGEGAGTLSAIRRAGELLVSNAARYCCIVGVDSLVNSHDIAGLEAAFRLKDVDRPMGIMPGEGAASFIVARGQGTHPGMARITGVGIAKSSGSNVLPDCGRPSRRDRGCISRRWGWRVGCRISSYGLERRASPCNRACDRGDANLSDSPADPAALAVRRGGRVHRRRVRGDRRGSRGHRLPQGLRPWPGLRLRRLVDG